MSRRLDRSLLRASLTAIALTLASTGHAETPEQGAERLFSEAKALAESGRYADACPRLEESQRLDPGIGTQFNLADCYEHTSRPVAAYKLFRQVEQVAKAAGKAERATQAHERAEALGPSLPRLKIVVSPGGRAPGLEVTLDGESLGKDSYGVELPLDAGNHVLQASAPGKATWQGSATLRASEHAELVVPTLADVARAAPTTRPGRTQRTLALIVGGVGVVGLGVGAVAGVVAIQKNNNAKQECPAPELAGTRDCSSYPQGALGASDWQSASTAGTISTIGFVAGGVGVVAAALLWFTAPSSKVEKAAIRAAPLVGRDATGIEVTGRF